MEMGEMSCLSFEVSWLEDKLSDTIVYNYVLSGCDLNYEQRNNHAMIYLKFIGTGVQLVIEFGWWID